MSALHATIYAARRRVIPDPDDRADDHRRPVLSLATGSENRWFRGPVATAIVWGLRLFGTVLTLIVIPLLFRLFMGAANWRNAAPHHRQSAEHRTGR